MPTPHSGTAVAERDWLSAEAYLDALEHEARDHAANAPDIVEDLFNLFSGPPLTGALCKGMTQDQIDRVFYPERRGKGHVTVATLARAREVCFACPALVPCLQRALEGNERQGIWAGTSRRTRLRIRVMIAEGRTTMARVLMDFALHNTARYDQLRPDATEEDSA